MPVITEYGPSPEYGPTPEFGPPLAGPLLGSYGPLPDPNADDTLTGKPSSQFIHIYFDTFERFSADRFVLIFHQFVDIYYI